MIEIEPPYYATFFINYVSFNSNDLYGLLKKSIINIAPPSIALLLVNIIFWEIFIFYNDLKYIAPP